MVRLTHPTESGPDECELQPDRALARGRPGGAGGDGPDGLGLPAPAPRDDRPLALVRPGAAAGRRLGLRAGVAPAVGHAPREEEAAGRARLPDRRLDEHEDHRRGARPEPLGHGPEDPGPSTYRDAGVGAGAGRT